MMRSTFQTRSYDQINHPTSKTGIELTRCIMYYLTSTNSFFCTTVLYNQDTNNITNSYRCILGSFDLLRSLSLASHNCRINKARAIRWHAFISWKISSKLFPSRLILSVQPWSKLPNINPLRPEQADCWDSGPATAPSRNKHNNKIQTQFKKSVI